MKTQYQPLPSLAQTMIHHTSTARASGFPRPRIERMRAGLERHLATERIPGYVIGVRHGSHELVEARGTFDFEQPSSMPQDTIFRLASTTKPITAIAAMILVEECKLRLDDSVEDWLPELKDRRVLRSLESPLDDTIPAKRSITLRDLLTFRSGYGEVFFASPASPLVRAMAEKQLPLSVWPFTGSQDELMKRLGELPLAHQPGERWLYHMSAEILGVLISRVAGKPLGAFLRERIFGPLAMEDTDFHVPEDKIGRLPTNYGTQFPHPELLVLDPARGGLYAQAPHFQSGAGGLVSTVNDLLTLGQMMLNGGSFGRERILSRSTVTLMTTDQITPEQKASSPFFEGFWESRGWGLGMSVVTQRRDLGESPGRFGWDGAFGTSWYVDPREKLIGVLLTQRRPDVLGMPPLVRDFWTLAYQLIDD